jgi:methanogenic corrinoid protein MtbC1
MSESDEKQVTLTEKEESLRGLTGAILAGTADDAKQRAYNALAKGNGESEILDAIVEAVNIISDLEELDQYDQAKIESLETSVISCLQILEEWLAKSETRFDIKITVGPVGIKAGALLSLTLAASLRSVGFHSTSLGKTQTALDLLRNSEELDADLVIPILSADGDEDLRNFTEAYDRGGFKSKFEIIPIAPGTSGNVGASITIARNSGEAISKATQWALKNERS